MIYQLDPTSTKPLHIQAEEILRKMILEDEYKDGKLLPNEVDLSKQLNISRNTLRQAINKLVFEGLLVRKKGYGTTVAMQKVMSNAKKWKSFSQEMQAQGLKIKNFELHLSYRKVSGEVANFFNTKPDEQLLCLERLRGTPELPFVYFISYFNPDIPMSVEEDMTLPLYEVLEKKFGIFVKTSKELISARKADAEMADKLGIPEGSPLLVRKRFVYDINSRPVEYNVGYYRADSFTYSIEFTND